MAIARPTITDVARVAGVSMGAVSFALNGMFTAIGRGVDVPGRLSVVGYGEKPLAAYLQPALTTVRTDVVGWGRAAAVRPPALVEREAAREIDLPPPELVIRTSTAPSRRPGTDAPTKDRRRSAPIRHRTEFR